MHVNNTLLVRTCVNVLGQLKWEKDGRKGRREREKEEGRKEGRKGGREGGREGGRKGRKRKCGQEYQVSRVVVKEESKGSFYSISSIF